MSDHEFEERVAICQVRGGLSARKARAVAIEQCGHYTRDEAPETWASLNRWWRLLVNDIYGQDRMRTAHDSLKQKHDVDSFKDLTIGQIWRSIEHLRSKKDD